jgi:hypothetical protein
MPGIGLYTRIYLGCKSIAAANLGSQAKRALTRRTVLEKPCGNHRIGEYENLLFLRAGLPPFVFLLISSSHELFALLGVIADDEVSKLSFT